MPRQSSRRFLNLSATFFFTLVFAALAALATPASHAQTSSVEAARMEVSARESMRHAPEVSAPPTVTANTNWVQQSPATSPSARSGASLAYDAETQQVVLFGGSGSSGTLNDTWTYNGTTWTQQSPANSPPARGFSTMAYDAQAGQVVLFGGSNGASFLGDTWTYNGTTWTQQSLATSPSARNFSTMAYDAATGQLVLFGGGSSTDGDLADTWAYNGTTWTQQSPATSPPGRSLATMVYSAATGKVVLFGGSSVNGLANDIWTYNGTTWTQQTPATSPPVRDEATMAYDVASSQVVLFGGFSGSSQLGDTWTYNGTTWTQQNLASSPSARDFSAMAYDAATEQVLLFGGSGGTLLNDTWTYVSGPPTFASTAIGSSTTGTATFSFTSGGSIGAPVVLTQGATGLDFTDAGTGSCTTNGTSHNYAVNDTCTVVVKFAPQYPGARLGAIEIKSTTGILLYTQFISGTGTGPQAIVSPGTLTTATGSGNQCTTSTAACGDGGVATASAAQLNEPAGVAVDGAGNIYIADFNDNRIRKITAATGALSTVAGSGTQCSIPTAACGDGGLATASGADLSLPLGVAVDGAGNIYIAEYGDNRIRKVTAATGILSTVAGDGNLCSSSTAACGDGSAATASGSSLYTPNGVTVDGAGNIYIADSNDNRIRKVTAASGLLSTVAGDGNVCAADTATCGDGSLATAAGSSLDYPTYLAVDGAGNLYIADTDDNRIRKVTASTGVLSTVAGDGNQCSTGTAACGDGNSATASGSSLSDPSGVAVDAGGDIYISDRGDNRVRKVTQATGVISTIAGSGLQCQSSTSACGDGTPATTSSSTFSVPVGLAMDSAGDLYIGDLLDNRVRQISTKAGIDFPTPTADGFADSTDGAMTRALNNIGNASLSLISLANGNNGQNFEVASPLGTGCVAGNPVAAGSSCLLGEEFNPVAPSSGLVISSLVVTDNSLNATAAVQNLVLAGNTVAGASGIQISSPTVAKGASSATFTVILAVGGTPADTGAITVTVNGSATGVGTPSCVSKAQHENCSYPYTGAPLATTGTYPVTVSVAADANYSSASGTGTLTVQ